MLKIIFTGAAVVATWFVVRDQLFDPATYNIRHACLDKIEGQSNLMSETQFCLCVGDRLAAETGLMERIGIFLEPTRAAETLNNPRLPQLQEQCGGRDAGT